jgi:hypothetical protein
MRQQALGLNEPVLGKEHPDTLMRMSNLANVLSDQVRYEQAEEIHRQATFSMPLNSLNKLHLLMLHRFGNRYNFATVAISVPHKWCKVTGTKSSVQRPALSFLREGQTTINLNSK